MAAVAGAGGTLDHRQEGQFRLAAVTVAMAQDLEIPARQRQVDGVERAVAQARLNDELGDDRGPRARLDGRAHRLIGGKLEHDRQRARVDAHRLRGRFEHLPRAGPRLPENPARFCEPSRIHRLAVEPGMALADDEHETIAWDLMPEQGWLLDLALDEAQIGQAVDHGFRHLCRVADGQVESDLRMALAEAMEVHRQPVIGDRLARLDAEPPALQSRELLERALGIGGVLQHRPRLREKHRAGLRELDAAADSVKERRPIAPLERRHGGAGGRLRQVKLTRGPRDVQMLRHDDEDAQLLQRHKGPSAVRRRSALSEAG